MRDVERDCALLLEAAGLGSTTSNPPSIYAGPFPATAPEAFIACRADGSGGAPEVFLGGTGERLHTRGVKVQVRGEREPAGYLAAKERAEAAHEALTDAYPVGYVRVMVVDAGPAYVGTDDQGRHLFSFNSEWTYGTEVQ
jgi:hypothetical protein